MVIFNRFTETIIYLVLRFGHLHSNVPISEPEVIHTTCIIFEAHWNATALQTCTYGAQHALDILYAVGVRVEAEELIQVRIGIVELLVEDHSPTSGEVEEEREIPYNS